MLLIELLWAAHMHISLCVNVPNNSAKGVSHTITIEDDLTIEAMQFSFTISNEQTRSYIPTEEITGIIQSSAGTDLALEVTSPSGTKAIILSSGQVNLYPAIDSCLQR